MDHYSKGACPDPPLPLYKIRGILRQHAEDKLHCDGKITITRTMGCPRQVILEDEFYHVIDPRSFVAAYEGTREHQDAAVNAPLGFYAEVTFPRPGQKPAMLFGVPISGTIDLLHADFSTIEEYKKHSEGAQWWVEKSRAKGDINWELAAQVNMQRLIVLQMTGHDVPNLIAWHIALTKAGGPPYAIRVRLPRMTEDEIANLRCFGSRYTVAENVRFMKRYYEHKQAGVSPRDAARQVPRAGLDMFKNRKGECKCDNYCAAKEVCDDVEGISNRI